MNSLGHVDDTHMGARYMLFSMAWIDWPGCSVPRKGDVCAYTVSPYLYVGGPVSLTALHDNIDDED